MFSYILVALRFSGNCIIFSEKHLVIAYRIEKYSNMKTNEITKSILMDQKYIFVTFILG